MDDDTLRKIGRACLFQALEDYWSLNAAEKLRDKFAPSKAAPVTNINRQKHDYYQKIIEETHDSADWFKSDELYPFSFCQICTMLGLDHEYIRRRLDTYTRARHRFVTPESFGVLDSQHAASEPLEYKLNHGPVCNTVQADLWENA